MRKLLTFVLFLVVFVFTSRMNGTTEAEYWANFETFSGEIRGPFVIANIGNDRRVNNKSWYQFEKNLSSDLKNALDSLFHPMMENSFELYTDTLFDFSKHGWEEKLLGYRKQSMKIDTVLGQDMKVVLEQLPVFRVKYYFSVEGIDKYFEISPYSFDNIDFWYSDEDTPFEKFSAYKLQVDRLIGETEFITVTALKTNKEGWHKPYIIKNGQGDEIYFDEEGFEELKVAKEALGETGIQYRNSYSGKVDENFVLWYDFWAFKIIVSAIIIAIVIQVILLLLKQQKYKVS